MDREEKRDFADSDDALARGLRELQMQCSRSATDSLTNESLTIAICGLAIVATMERLIRSAIDPKSAREEIALEAADGVIEIARFLTVLNVDLGQTVRDRLECRRGE